MTAIRRFLLFPVVFGMLLWVSPRAAFPALALPSLFDDEFDKKPWQEIEVVLPAFPQPENLIPVDIDAVTTSMRFLIDEKSISVDSDEVIRYSLVALSPSGARNVSYEGMRCAAAERRVYAFGQADGTWSKARSNQWVRIQGSRSSYQVVLFLDYFCAIGQRAIMTPEDAIRVLRQGGIGTE
ncbi:MAG: CNP1-like family protein [Candidatus Accumulibacter sp.]|jgi:hypothetical protein|nr:CNP1-like family protein [Accumulibacter sp.]